MLQFDFRARRSPAGLLVITLGALLAAVAPVALALQITTSWHTEQYKDPQDQLATPVIAAALRNNDHIYELHLICGRDQYDGDTPAARRDGPVLELAISTFNSNEKPTPIHTQTEAGQAGKSIDIGLRVGNMSQVTRTFRADKATNVISAAFPAGDNLGNNGDGPNVAGQFIEAAKNNAKNNQGITVTKVLDHESVTLAFSRDNPQVDRFLNECPITTGR